MSAKVRQRLITMESLSETREPYDEGARGCLTVPGQTFTTHVRETPFSFPFFFFFFLSYSRHPATI